MAPMAAHGAKRSALGAWEAIGGGLGAHNWPAAVSKQAFGHYPWALSAMGSKPAAEAGNGVWRLTFMGLLLAISGWQGSSQRVG